MYNIDITFSGAPVWRRAGAPLRDIGSYPPLGATVQAIGNAIAPRGVADIAADHGRLRGRVQRAGRARLRWE
jgi:hypothetical protein